jgi:23S rRNA (uracil1939-C5)-methyltransferase
VQIRLKSFGAMGACFAVDEEGKAVLVNGGIPGELVEASISKSCSSYSLARAEKVLEASPDRVTPPCPLYGSCGGCDLMHMSYACQLRLKSELLGSQAQKLGFEVLEPKASESLGYRSRVRFSLVEGRPAFMDVNNQPILVKACPVLCSSINDFISHRSFDSDQLSLVMSDEGPLISPCEGFITVLGKRLPVSNQVFFQSNLMALEALIGLVKDNVVGASAMDLFAGVGTFSAFLEDEFKTLAVESNPACLRLAQMHLKKARIISKDVKLLDRSLKADTVIIDPPRVGLDKAFLPMLRAFARKRVIYVSCDGATFFRDAKALIALGLKPVSFRMLDFYPQTHHTESIAVLDV